MMRVLKNLLHGEERVRMRGRRWWQFILLILMVGVSTSFAEDFVIPLDVPPPPDVQEIEIVRVEGKKPTVEFRYKTTISAEPKIEVLSGKVVDLLPRLGDPTAPDGCGAEAARNPKFFYLSSKAGKESAEPCLIPFAANDGVVDILSFDTMVLTGTAAGSLSLALVDRIGSVSGKGFEIAKVGGKLDLTVELAAVVPSIDLRRMAGLRVTPGGGKWSLKIVKASLTVHPSAGEVERRRGLWLWDTLEALQDVQGTLETCQSLHCSRLAVQIPDLSAEEGIWMAYGRLMTAAQKKGIEALALDGYPEAVLQPEPLIERVQKVLATAPNSIAGIQLDIEPYLLKNATDGSEEIDRKYLDLVSRMAGLVRQQSNLSVVLPFWYMNRRVDGRSVGFSVMSQVDDVVVMSYRTNREELLSISNDWMRYSTLTGIPIWVAVETRPIPLEEHIVLVIEPDRPRAAAYLDAEGSKLILKPPDVESVRAFRIRERFSVRPERLTFAGSSKRKLVEFLEAVSADPEANGTAGIMIHDWTGYRQLPD